MDPTVVSQPPINMLADIQPVDLPDASITLPERVTTIEEELNINY